MRAGIPSTSCGHDGTCDGAGACRLYLVGTVCANETCTGSTDSPPRHVRRLGRLLAATTASLRPVHLRRDVLRDLVHLEQ